MPINPLTIAFSISIKPSLQKWLLVISPHFLALIIVSLIAKTVVIGITMLLIFLIFLSMIYYSQLHLFLNRNNSVTDIRQDSAKNWLIKCNDPETDDYIMVDLLGTSFSSNALIILNFMRKEGKPSNNHNVIITPDSLTNDGFRCLKTRLKLMKTLDELMANKEK